MAHYCHALDCHQPIEPKLLFCRIHWHRVETPVREAIYAEYRPGQERDKRPSARYMAVQKYAVAMASFKPNDEQRARACRTELREALRWQERAIQRGEGDPLLRFGIPADESSDLKD